MFDTGLKKLFVLIFSSKDTQQDTIPFTQSYQKVASPTLLNFSVHQNSFPEQVFVTTTRFKLPEEYSLSCMKQQPCM